MLNAVPRAAILAFLLCLSAKSSGVFAQGSLQFNQVLLVNTLDTVPANKVWKIEALAYNGGHRLPVKAPLILLFLMVPGALIALRGF